MPKLGILVMGQSPRPEIELEFGRLLDGVELDQRGCLDGLSRDKISDLKPQPAEPTLFTRLPNGEAVTLSKASVISHGTKQLDVLEKSGATAVVVLCTGEFPQWSGRRVLLPSLILRNFVFGLAPTGRLGILSPLEAQVPAAKKRWSANGHTVSAVALSPNASTKDTEASGAALAKKNLDLLVFDCVSYTKQTKEIVCSAANRPGVLAITAIARSAAEVLEGCGSDDT